MRMWVRSLASLRGLRIWSCHKLWCRLQTQLGSGVAGAGAGPGSCSSNSKPSLGTSISHDCGSTKKKEKKKIKKRKESKELCQSDTNREKNLLPEFVRRPCLSEKHNLPAATNGSVRGPGCSEVPGPHRSDTRVRCRSSKVRRCAIPVCPQRPSSAD